MNRIRVLPEQVASLIAAGEVIERPASVVRELVDNSIDAKATRIVTWIEKGGRSLIRVTDNGEGMTKDDLLLSVERHATSKIKSASDLYSIRTLGFRGEALPSIAAVSKVEITSKHRNDIAGYRLSIRGGKLLALEEVGAPEGTTVEARDLFFNLPARRKFLRSSKTEAERVMDTLSRMALPYPAIQFEFIEDGRKRFNLPPTDQILTRIALLMGKEISRAMKEYVVDSAGVKIKVWVSPPEFSRSRGDKIFIYVNKRSIRDKFLNKAVMEGYGQRLMRGRFPQVVLFIEIEPDQVDVNVHPAKQEVRFKKAAHVFDQIRSAIDKALSPPAHGQIIKKDIWRSQPFQVHEPETCLWSHDITPTPQPPGGFVSLPQEIASMALFEPEIRIVGQLGKAYILCETHHGLLIVDQHAAHERILYEELKASMAESGLEIQRLLVPVEIELGQKEARVVEENVETLKTLGIEVEHFGGQSFLIHTIPALLGNIDPKEIVQNLILTIKEGRPGGGVLVYNLLEVMACHGSIRAGQDLSYEEMVGLISRLKEMKLPTNCPHGRPITRHLSYRDLEKMFKRIV